LKKNGVYEMAEPSKSYLRNIIGNYMLELGRIDDRVVIVNADLMGTSRNETFVKEFPKRAFNVGIAEQNMVSFSAGLAHEGFIPYAFSMAPFISMRACEQCRTDVAYGNLNVRLMATYAGCSGGISGATHWGIEDCAIMSGIPGMTVLEPCDAVQAKKMLEKTLDYNGSIYIRSSVEPVSDIYGTEYDFQIGKASIVRNGDDGAFICSGVVVQYAIEASKILENMTGKQIRVVDMHTIKPIDKEAIIEASMTGNIVVAQDHNIMGGLGSIVAAVIAEERLHTKFKILGVGDRFTAMAHAPYLYHMFGYDTDGLVKTMLEFIK
jgi:transketolase